MQPSPRSAPSVLTVASREAPHQLASCSWERLDLDPVALQSLAVGVAQPGREHPEQLQGAAVVAQQRRARRRRRLYLTERERRRRTRRAVQRRKIADHVARSRKPSTISRPSEATLVIITHPRSITKEGRALTILRVVPTL